MTNRCFMLMIDLIIFHILKCVTISSFITDLLVHFLIWNTRLELILIGRGGVRPFHLVHLVPSISNTFVSLFYREVGRVIIRRVH